MPSLKKIPLSDHFNGKRFFNPGVSEHSFWGFLLWRLTAQRRPWPKFKPFKTTIPAKRLNDDELHITYVNHSTMLIQWGSLNILTDPIWSKRASPFRWMGPKRIHHPGVAFNHLPPIDFILLSHNHYDHMDIKTLKRLSDLYHPKMITGLGNKAFLESRGIRHVIECDWWQEMQFPFGRLIFTPAQHFSARSLWDRNRTLWGGFALQKGNEWIYFAGDTGYFEGFKTIKSRLGAPRVALLPIGAYEPRWFMEKIHMSPKEALQAHLDLGARTSIATHFGTFRLSDEGFEDPIEYLKREKLRLGIAEDSFIVMAPGETRKLLDTL